MIRLLQLLILVALAVLVWRLVRKALGTPGAAAKAPPEFEPTARCRHCGTHVPRAQLDAAGACAKCGR